MAYRVLAIDLDDTLLDKRKMISQRNYEAICHAQKQGVVVILVSGRAYTSMLPYNQALGIHGYTVALAGGQVWDETGELVYATNLPPIAANQVMRWAAMRNIHYQAYLEDGLYFPRRSRFSDFYETQCGIQGKVDPGLIEREAIVTPKVLYVDTPAKIAEYKPMVTAAFPELTVLCSQQEYLEVLSPETSKANGLSYVVDRLGFVSEQVLAIGDSEIDISMLQYAGMGVAMQNASDAVLAVADDVTDDHEQDGVAKAIEKYVR